jgi:hypothetical protein
MMLFALIRYFNQGSGHWKGARLVELQAFHALLLTFWWMLFFTALFHDTKVVNILLKVNDFSET